MKPSARNKIIIVFFVLLIGWFFIRMVRLLIPLVIIAIIVGFIWDWFGERDKNGGGRY
ncbi:MAG: hypothetical protein GQ574_01435 [Crocinitomix sp.]|nr:hypothetical protein [Crocinitomix sp.]